MTAVRDKIISYIGQGVSQVVTAEACGVTASYVNQVLEEAGVSQEIAKIRAGKLHRDLEVDSNIADIERDALKAISKKLPYVKGPLEAAKIFQIVNAARKRNEVARDDANSDSLSVTLVLPKAANVMIEVNTRQQVVAVNDQSIAPLPSRALPAMAAKLLPQSGIIDVTALPPVRRMESHEVALVAKAREADKQRAASIFENMKVMQGGVELDI